jgi:ubiquinone/menaquinone biosynthesis C-methylase UbiE
VSRLARQANVAAAEEEALTRVGCPHSGRLLDLGCGPGFVVERLLRRRPGLQIVGVDRDRLTLPAARARTAVAAADAGALPFPGATFDFVHLRLVLRHLRHPAAVLREIWRVVRPGGGIGVVDTDDGALVIDPMPEGFAEVLAARQETFRRRGADPFIGRRLASLLSGAAFTGLELVALPLTSFDIGAAAFSSIVLAPIADAVDPDLCPTEKVREAATALRAWGQRRDAFAMTTAVVAGGRKLDTSNGSLPT